MSRRTAEFEKLAAPLVSSSPFVGRTLRTRLASSTLGDPTDPASNSGLYVIDLMVCHVVVALSVVLNSAFGFLARMRRSTSQTCAALTAIMIEKERKAENSLSSIFSQICVYVCWTVNCLPSSSSAYSTSILTSTQTPGVVLVCFPPWPWVGVCVIVIPNLIRRLRPIS